LQFSEKVGPRDFGNTIQGPDLQIGAPSLQNQAGQDLFRSLFKHVFHYKINPAHAVGQHSNQPKKHKTSFKMPILADYAVPWVMPLDFVACNMHIFSITHV
jgi:hypothetical protein